MKIYRSYSFCFLALLLVSCGTENSTVNDQANSTPTPIPTQISAEEIARWEQRASNVEIVRDHWGIAHIYGSTDADTVFGTLYAQAEDDFNRVETNYINAMGRLAEAEGAGQIYRDLRMKLFIDPAEMQSMYDTSPAWLQELMNAFADGLNYYLHTHPEVTPRVISKFEPWMALSFTEGSIGGDIERISTQELQNFYGAGDQLAQLSNFSDNEPRGSNGFAIAPENSASGNALLLINPHTSFFFRSELHMVSEEGLNAYGAVTWGQFFIYQGFNENTGWMHTSSRADAIDEFLETIIEREDGVYYLHGGEEKKLDEKIITVSYKDGEELRSRQFTTYRSHHGPIVRGEDDKWVAFSIMEEPIKALSQSYGRTKADNYEEFAATMELRTNSSNNTVYADSNGNIGYWHGNYVPRRNQQFNWNAPLDGSNPATDYRGLHSLNEIITVVNPETGWIQNTNNTPFNASGTASPVASDYPAYMANNPENYRGIHAVRVLENETNFTIDSLIEAAYDPVLPAFEELIPDLLIITAVDQIAGPNNNNNDAINLPGLTDQVSIQSDLLEYIDLFRTWDFTASVDSVETSLAVYYAQQLMEAVREEANASGVNIYQYMANRSSLSQKLTALRAAAVELTEGFGDWRVPWGEINRYQRLNGDLVQDFNDDEPSIPVGFASGRWGSLASFGARTYPGTNRMYGTSGNSFVAAVEFGDRLSAKAITVGGLQSDPDSPHFDDQAEMYANGEFRDVLFYREDVEANLERAYNPGR
ncbi:MAG: acylase [Pseudomonadales bacterium]|nr:acylase [Pseudomonadales bacterium]